MKSNGMRGWVALGLGIWSANASAALAPGEPAFCDPQAFAASQVQVDDRGLERARLYRLGAVRLLGLAVGQSDVERTQETAGKLALADSVAAERHCTFYFNDGNREAADAFVWEKLPKPTGTSYARTADEYLRRMGDLFDVRAQNFLSCAEKHRYVALGCDGMKHRGPTVFAMLLAYAGCSPERATAIVKRAWGENGIRREMREALAAAAARLGAAHPAQRARMQALLGGVAR